MYTYFNEFLIFNEFYLLDYTLGWMIRPVSLSADWDWHTQIDNLSHGD